MKEQIIFNTFDVEVNLVSCPLTEFSPSIAPRKFPEKLLVDSGHLVLD